MAKYLVCTPKISQANAAIGSRTLASEMHGQSHELTCCVLEVRILLVTVRQFIPAARRRLVTHGHATAYDLNKETLPCLQCPVLI